MRVKTPAAGWIEVEALKQPVAEGRAETAGELARAQRLFQSAIDALADEFFLIDPVLDGAGRVVDAVIRHTNLASRVPGRKDLAAGGRLLALSPWLADTPLLPTIEQVVAEHTPATVRLTRAHVNGVRREYEYRIAPGAEGLVVTGHEVTERRRLEAIAHRLASVVESAQDAIVMEDPGGFVLSWNPAAERLYGYRAEEMLGRNIRVLFPPGADDEHASNVAALAAGRPVPLHGTTRITRQGELVWVELTISPVTDPSGELIGGASIARDVSDRRRAELERREAQEALGRLNRELEQRVAERTAELEAANHGLESFSYSVSHDLRAPLRAVSGFTEILLRRYSQDLDPEGVALAERVVAAAGRMGRLIDDILSFSRAGRATLVLSRLDMGAIVASVLAEQRAAAGAPDTQVVVGRLPAAYGDPAMVRQVWTNLIANAFKFSSHAEGPRIRIWGERAGGLVTFHVADNGAGFDMAYADQLFGVFRRLHSDAEFPGTGIGLAMVRQTIQRHGGTVGAVGEPGRGATFSFSLPARAPGRPVVETARPRSS